MCETPCLQVHGTSNPRKTRLSLDLMNDHAPATEEAGEGSGPPPQPSSHPTTPEMRRGWTDAEARDVERTQRNSRAHTLALALDMTHQALALDRTPGAEGRRSVCIHVVGADRNEGMGPDSTFEVFRGLIEAVAAGGSSVSVHLHLLLCGPNLPPEVRRRVVASSRDCWCACVCVNVGNSLSTSERCVCVCITGARNQGHSWALGRHSHHRVPFRLRALP